MSITGVAGPRKDWQSGPPVITGGQFEYHNSYTPTFTSDSIINPGLQYRIVSHCAMADCESSDSELAGRGSQLIQQIITTTQANYERIHPHQPN
jgi:hypothetical protein